MIDIDITSYESTIGEYKMELNKHSKNVTQDPTQPAAQAMLYAIGLTEEDLKKNLLPWSNNYGQEKKLTYDCLKSEF